MHESVIPALRMWRQADPWGFPTSQSSLLGKLQTGERPWLKKPRWIGPEEQHIEVDLYVYIHKDACVCACTHKCTYSCLHMRGGGKEAVKGISLSGYQIGCLHQLLAGLEAMLFTGLKSMSKKD